MELREYLEFLRGAWLLLAVGLLVGVASGGAYTIAQTPVYESTARVFVGPSATGNVNDLSAGNTYAQAVVVSYATVGTDQLVLAPVVRALGLHTTPVELSKEITVTNPPGTVVIDVTVRNASPRTAADIANAVTDSLINAVSRLTPAQGAGVAPVTVTRTSTAMPASTPVSPRLPLDLTLGAVVGLVIALAIAVLRRVIDNKIRRPNDLKAVGAPLLGAIPRFHRAKSLIGADDVRSTRGEAFRLLRTNLRFMDVDRATQVIQVTSPVAGDGKTTVSTNLAVSLIHADESVVLVDADLRRPGVADSFQMEGAIGLTDVLIGEVPLSEALQRWGDTSLFVLPAGAVPPNPSELLQSSAMATLLAELRNRFSMVLLDSPPLNPVADSSILAASADGVLLVVAEGRTSRPELDRAAVRLQQVHARVLGTVMNLQQGRDAESVGYGQYPTLSRSTASGVERGRVASEGVPAPE